MAKFSSPPAGPLAAGLERDFCRCRLEVLHLFENFTHSNTKTTLTLTRHLGPGALPCSRARETCRQGCQVRANGAVHASHNRERDALCMVGHVSASVSQTTQKPRLSGMGMGMFCEDGELSGRQILAVRCERIVARLVYQVNRRYYTKKREAV